VKNRSILLAIGIAVAILSIWLENPVNTRGSLVAGTVPCFIAADNGAAFEGVRLAGMVREVTAYNVGVPEQTSENPCIGASGQDLCRLVREGRNVCAANFVALGTVLRIEKYGECVVLDRMHRRFSHRVDIAMKEDAVEDARAFGLKRRVVGVKADLPLSVSPAAAGARRGG